MIMHYLQINLIFGNLKLNLSAAKLESSEKSIDLTHTELLILETLFKAKGISQSVIVLWIIVGKVIILSTIILWQ